MLKICIDMHRRLFAAGGLLSGGDSIEESQLVYSYATETDESYKYIFFIYNKSVKI